VNRIKVLFEKPKRVLQQCEAQRAYKSFSDFKTPDRRCTHFSAYEVDGKKLCTQHAGVAALKILLERETDEES